MLLPLNKIYPNPDQPRKEFDQDKLTELAMSIKEYGVIEPIVVTPRGDRFMIIAGERRYRASQLAKLSQIPAEIKDADKNLVEELALLENIQRQDLNPIEEARAYQALIDRKLTKETISGKMGFRHTRRINDRLRLLDLKPEYQSLVISEKLSVMQAFEIARLKPSSQTVAYNKILSGELSTHSKLRAYVNAVLAIEGQVTLFTVRPITEVEKQTTADLDNIICQAEKLIAAFYDQDKAKHLKKIAYHTALNVSRLDLIIQSLQSIKQKLSIGCKTREAVKNIA